MATIDTKSSVNDYLSVNLSKRLIVAIGEYF